MKYNYLEFPKVAIDNKLDFDRYLAFIESRPYREIKRIKGFHIHHVHPISLGGKDVKENKILLTIREHFIAHLILYNCGYPEMISALYLMTTSNRFEVKLSSRQFERLQEKYRKKQSVNYMGESNPNYGKGLFKEKNGMYHKHHSEEARNKMSKTKKERGSLKGEKNPRYGNSHSEISREKMSQSQKRLYQNGYQNPRKGVSLSEEQKKKLSEKAKERVRGKAGNSKKVKCIETGQEFDCIKTAAEIIYGSDKFDFRIQFSLKENKPKAGYSWMIILK